MILDSFMNFIGKIMFFTGFVNSATGFPKPLTPQEEKEELIKAKNGDKSAKEKLINHNLRLVAHIVKKYSNAGDADDMISAGTIGLIKAVNSYELCKGTQLSTYAARCIENEILMLIRLSKKHNQVLSLEESFGKDKDGNEICLQDIIACENDDLQLSLENSMLSEKLYKIVKDCLEPREFEIICYRYGLGGKPVLPQREVAKLLGISRSYISRLENKALKSIKNVIDKNDLI